MFCRASYKFLLLLTLVLTFVSGAAAQPESAGEDTQQAAVASGVTVPLTEKVEVFALGAYIRGERATTFAQIDVRFKVNKFLTITPGYFGLFIPKVNGRRDYDNRARIAATLNFTARKLQISTRNLVERRFRTSEDSTRYRNQIQLKHPVKLGKAKFDVFGYTEPFYDFDQKQLTRNHAALGAGKTFAERYTTEVYYFGQNIRERKTIHALVFSFNVRLPQLFKKK